MIARSYDGSPLTDQAYLPSFSTDIFISYSHVDNHDFDLKGTLWVDYFHRELQGLVNTCVGRPVKIWRDPRLSGTSVFSGEIAERLQKTAVLLAIVSPGYLASDWCKRERETFVESCRDNGGLDVGNSRRIISALKLPVAREDFPDVLKLALGFPFFGIDEQSGKAIDYLFDERPLYMRTLSHLAQAIADLLKLMRYGPSSRASKSAGATVYVAETTSDLQRERDALRMELEARGCVVVPRQPLPHDVESCAEAAAADLARSNLSFHLLGKRYGLIPEGGSQSMVELQTDLATHRTFAGFTPVLWIPRGLEPAEGQQRAFLERVRTQRNTAAQFELLESSFEELKTFAIDCLERKPAPVRTNGDAKPSEPEPSAVPHIYLVRDREDRENVAPLSKYLFDQGFEVITPPDEGEEVKLRENHQENLKSCDAIMIWWGTTKKVWLDYMMRDLDRARGLGRTAPFRATAVCIAAPPARDKDDFMTHRARVIRFSGDFAPEPLASLVEAIRSPANA